MTDDLTVMSETPFNAETNAAALQTFITPSTAFYIRSHGDIPRIDPARYRLHVDGAVTHPLELSLADLDRFAKHEITATLQCAGNRRAGLNEVRPVTGDLWRVGAIGTAIWRGVCLGDLLHAAGAATGPDLHVALDSLDECDANGETFRYGVSIPMPKALGPEVLLAHQMNGAALAPEHGYPLRAIVPGYAGVRSPKWLSRIVVRATPSDGHVQARDYKLLPAHVTAETVDWDAGLTINDMPLTSAITSPAPGATLAAGATRIAGYAIASGRRIVRVDVSADQGDTWRQAQLLPGATAWSWQLWQAELTLQPGPCELIVRGWNCAGETQPSTATQTWNFKGYLNNAWHRVAVTVV